MDGIKGQKEPQKQEKPAEKLPKLTALEQRAIQLVKENPMLSNYQIGKKLKDLGVSANERSIYSRLKKNEYLHGEIDKIRQHNLEMVSREIVPAALKIHKEVLKSKPSQEVWCSAREVIVNAGKDCKNCEKKSTCMDYFNYCKEVNHHNSSKKDWVAMAEKVEFRIDDTKRVSVPQTINFTEVRAIIQQIINTDMEPGYFKGLPHKGDED